jgi:hypothetical protein
VDVQFMWFVVEQGLTSHVRVRSSVLSVAVIDVLWR